MTLTLRATREVRVARRPHFVRKFLDLSTAHLSPAALEWLEAASFAEAADPLAGYTGGKTTYGWFIWAPDEPAEGAFPADLLPIFAFARMHGCEYVLFDCDAFVVDELQQYELEALAT